MPTTRSFLLLDSPAGPQASAIAWGADPYALGAHMSRCRQALSPWFSLRCAAENVRDFATTHAFTTLVLTAIVARVISLAV